MINYSIIIPHKNIPLLLQRCLDSIPKRSDVQIIVVDDNSNPEFVNFSSFPGLNSPCVEAVFTKEGRGAGYARNVALGKAKGRWLLFADADDFFYDNMFELLDLYLNSEADIIYFDYNSVYSETLIVCPIRMPWVKQYLKNKDKDSMRFNSSVPWAKMISRKLVEEHLIRFDETKAANDVMFSTYIGYHAKSVEICPEPLYYVTERQDSLWFGIQFDSIRDRMLVSCKYNSFMREVGRKEYRFYTYRWVKQSKSYGMKSYMKILWIYLKKEPINIILTDLGNLLRAKFLGGKNNE